MHQLGYVPYYVEGTCHQVEMAQEYFLISNPFLDKVTRKMLGGMLEHTSYIYIYMFGNILFIGLTMMYLLLLEEFDDIQAYRYR